MSRSRARLAADWFAKLRQNVVTNEVEHTNVTDVVADVTTVSNTALNSGSPLNAANLTGTLPAIDGSALTGVGGSTTYGAVGTYVWGRRTGSAADQAQFVAGTTYAGNTLYPAGISGNYALAALYWSSNGTMYGGDVSAAALSGTWRAMGTTHPSERENPETLFVRIS